MILVVWRGIILVVCLASMMILTMRFIKNSKLWNSKTRDYWYALMMWSLAGFVISFEGIRQQSPFSARLIFLSAAALVSLIGLRRKGEWGSAQDM